MGWALLLELRRELGDLLHGLQLDAHGTAGASTAPAPPSTRREVDVGVGLHLKDTDLGMDQAVIRQLKMI